MGCSRRAFRLGRYALKVPNLWYGWTAFLRGLLHNMEEAGLYRWLAKDPQPGADRICPVLWSCPGGWLNVMPWCEPALPGSGLDWMTEEWWTEDYDAIREMTKDDNIGWLGDRLVIFDYASSR